MDDDVLTTISASAPRRVIGVGMLVILGLLLVYLAFLTPQAGFGWQAFLLVLGLATLWLTDKMRRATLLTLELTRTHLRDSEGTVIAKVADIKSVERGVFAFKPSNGFTIHLTESASRRWQPGLWWRMGKRVGIGGVTAPSQTKSMAEIIAALIAERG